MNVAFLLDNLNEAKSLLKNINLLKIENSTRARTLKPNKFSSKFWAVCTDKKYNYHEIYQIAMENSDYDFILTDDSFFQFSCDSYDHNTGKGRIRYAFYQNPRKYPTYDEFLIDNGFLIDECGDMFYEDYEQFICEAELRRKITTIRYDYNFCDYRPPYHPVSHLHIGYNNDVRIALGRVLSPVKFISFVVRNVFKSNWRDGYSQNSVFKNNCLDFKENCSVLENIVFNEDEKKLLHIT